MNTYTKKDGTQSTYNYFNIGFSLSEREHKMWDELVRLIVEREGEKTLKGYLTRALHHAINDLTRERDNETSN